MVSLGAKAAQAQNLPGSVDAGRITAQPEKALPAQPAPQLKTPDIAPAVAPEGAENMTFLLKEVVIEGMSALPPEEIQAFYAPWLGQTIPLSRLWELAEYITSRYQQAGYFLSRAYVPAQEISDGIVTLRVVEGYIGDVQIEGALQDNRLVNTLKRRITSQKPARLGDLESALLLLNDIPGLSFTTVLGKMKQDAAEGAVRLVLKQQQAPAKASMVFNNYGSRFTGPYRINMTYEDSFLPNQSTTLSGLASLLPISDELWALSAAHEIKLLPDLSIDVSLGRTVSKPGYTLAANKIESRSVNWGLDMLWQVRRQRLSNLSVGLALDGRNVSTNILGTPLTRDRIRALRLKGTYDGRDPLGGYNALNATLSHGIPGLGASAPGALNLSRADAKPDFAKIEATWQRSQFIASDWLSIMTLTGQRASKALYSSEEFGFGGAALGRAYDASELTGDHGVGGAVELQYTGIDPIKKFRCTPSVFYEIGKIWNIDNGQDDGLSIADIGAGFNLTHPSGLSANLTIAQPISKTIATPTYGNNGHNPRLYFQLGWSF